MQVDLIAIEFLHAYDTHFMACNTHKAHTTNPAQRVYRMHVNTHFHK